MIEDDNYKKYLLVRSDSLEEVVKRLERIEKLVQNNNSGNGLPGDYIDQQTAMELLHRKPTWFWNMRRSGKLIGKKAGGSWYYKKSEILNFIEAR